jgi:hypothetical protein
MIWALLVDLGECQSDDVDRVVLLAVHRGASPGTVVTERASQRSSLVRVRASREAGAQLRNEAGQHERVDL